MKTNTSNLAKWSRGAQARSNCGDRHTACVAFSPGGNTLTTASPDKTVCLWRAEPGAELGVSKATPSDNNSRP